MQAPTRLSSGKYVDLMNLKKEDISVEDISSSLNLLYRFNGHHKDHKPLTVAQHTMLCMELAEELFPNEIEVVFNCLLHDMPEAIYGDIPTPVKRAIGPALKEYTRGVDNLVYDALWPEELVLSEEVEEKTKVCDLLALDIERRVLWSSQLGKNNWPEAKDVGFNLKEKRKLFDKAYRLGWVDLHDIYDTLIEEITS